MANTTKKTTKREYFTMVIEIINQSDNEKKNEIVDFINHEIELLDKKSGGSKKKNDEIKNEIKTTIVKVLKEADAAMTITEMLQKEELATYEEGSELKVMSAQRLSAIIKQMKEEGTVVRTEEKKKAYFSLLETK